MKAARIMDQVRSSVGLRHRQIKENGKARTEGMINSLVDADPDYERARAAFETAQTFEEFSKQILEAFRYRRDAIRIIVDQMQSELGDKYKEANKIAAMEQNQNLSQAARRKYTRLKNADDTDEDSEY
jgi:KaiC/GvpD/RAD55 family RecA-like ATPase